MLIIVVLLRICGDSHICRLCNLCLHAACHPLILDLSQIVARCILIIGAARIRSTRQDSLITQCRVAPMSLILEQAFRNIQILFLELHGLIVLRTVRLVANKKDGAVIAEIVATLLRAVRNLNRISVLHRIKNPDV